MNTLDQFKNELSTNIYGITKEEAAKKGICVDCRKPALANCYSQAGKNEYFISGLCEKCYDKIFEGE